MFIDRKTQYCEEANNFQIDLYVQYNPNPIISSYFVEKDN